MDHRRIGMTAVVLGLLVGTVGGATAQDGGDPSDYESWRTKEVAPGILRILDDGAGHDLAQKWPRNRGSVNRIAVGPEGDVWVSVTVPNVERNRSNESRLWPLGRERTYGRADGLGRYHGSLAFDDEGRLWLFGERIATFEDGEWSSTRASNSVEAADGSVWLGNGMGVEQWDGAELVPHLEGTWTGSVFLGPDDKVGVEGWGGPLLFDGSDWQQIPQSRPWRAVSGDGLLAVIGQDGKGVQLYGNDQTTTVLDGARINSIAAAPDGSLWIAGRVGRNRGAVYRIDPAAVFAALAESAEDAGGTSAEEASST
jgi:hypothetical protein